MSEKSILEQALLQVQNLEEAVKQNAKGILASTMKEELSDLLKESLEEEEKVETNEEEVAIEPNEEEEKDMSDEESGDDEESEDSIDLDKDEEPAKGIDDMDSEEGVDDEESSDDSFGDFGGDASDDEEDMDSDDMGSDDDEVMDMTGASDDEVLKVFKAMKPEDGIVVKKDGNKVELEAGDDQYIIKLDEEEEKSTEEDETLYEIELDEEEETNESALKGLSNPKKVEAKESALKGLSNPKKVEAKESALKGLSNPKKVEAKEEEEETDAPEAEVDEASRTFAADVRNPANQGKKYKAGRHDMNEEVTNLKKEILEYKKALVLFKEKFNEIAVFNANLAHATRLFTEHSTTKQEKMDILKRFDSVSTINESKNLFTQIKSEFGTKTTVTETVAEKISNTPQTSTSQEVLAESKAYENPQFARMRDLMKKVK